MGIADGSFGTADSFKCRRYSLFPMHADGSIDAAAAIYEDRFNVYIRSDGNAKWDGEKLSSLRHAVVVQRGYLVATLLQEQSVAINQ